MNIRQQLKDQMNATWDRGKAILDRADQARRELTAAEEAEYRQLTHDLDDLGDQLRRLDESERSASDMQRTFRRIADRPTDGHWRPDDAETLGHQIREAVATNSLAPIEVKLDTRSGYSPGIEARSVTTSGMVGVTFSQQLVRHLVEGSAILSAGATLVTTDTGEPLKVPKTSADSTAAIVAEGGPISSSDPGLGSVTLGAYKYGFLVQVSYEFTRDVSFDLDGYLAEQGGRALANAFGAHAITGTGTSQPRGVLTDATTGITGGTGVAGAFTADNLIDLYHSVAEPYARSAGAAWLMRSATLGVVRKLKAAGTGEYLFNIDVPANYPGAAGMLLGRPVYIDPTMPAVGLNAKSVAFGDFTKYWVRTAGTLRFDRDISYGFNTDMVTFRCLWSADGALVDTTGAVKTFNGGAS